MKDFLPNINWLFLLQIFILILAWQVSRYLYTSFNRLEKYSKQDEKTVLNEPSNFIERQIVKDTIIYKIIAVCTGLFLLIGFLAFLFSVAIGYNRILKLPGLQDFWSQLFFYIGTLSFIFLASRWLLDSFKNSKSLTDYEKIKKYLKTRETLNIKLQLGLLNYKEHFFLKLI
jgi:hypothetical protein